MKINDKFLGSEGVKGFPINLVLGNPLQTVLKLLL